MRLLEEHKEVKKCPDLAEKVSLSLALDLTRPQLLSPMCDWQTAAT